MYPSAPLSAAAFMKSDSSCRKVSAVAGFGSATDTRTPRVMPLATSAIITIVRIFMMPPKQSEILSHHHRAFRLPFPPTATLFLVTLMKSSVVFLCTLACGAIALLAATPPQNASAPAPAAQTERHFRNVHQLTFGGQNAEAYFSADGKKLIFQSTREPWKCDQIFIMNVDGSDQHVISTGKGRTTCSYFYPDGKKILYSSTHLGSADCPPKPDYSRGYVWGIYPSYDIFTAHPDGSDLKQLTTTPGYDAEAVISSDGKKIVFTSIRNGDLDIYTMNADGSNVKQLTHELGYDGGPTFSPDGQLIVYRAHHPKTEQEIADYKDLLKQNMIRPTYLE